MASNKEINKQEATRFVAEFYQSSWNWRNQSYHAKWDKWERNYRSIYDPNIKAKKDIWQAAMFDPLTVTNVEVIGAAMTKVLMGRKRPIGIEPREMGDRLQAQLHSELLDHQIDKSDYVCTFDAILKQAEVFGSGFGKFYWDRRYAKRRLQETVHQAPILNEIMAKFGRKQTVNSKEVVKEVKIKDQVCFEMVPIRDIFLVPNSIDMKTVLHRNKLTYGELVNMSEQKNGYGDVLLDAESVEKLAGMDEGNAFSDFSYGGQTGLQVDKQDSFNQEERAVKADQKITDVNTPTTLYGKKKTIFEYWGDIPRKWIELGLDPEKKSSQELIPGKIMIASGSYFLASEENPFFAMEPPFLKMDYINTWQTYGLGVAELLEGLQEEINELRNQRVDNVNLLMNKIFLVLEKYLVDPNEVRSKPGATIRIKGSEVDDVRKAVAEMPISDVALSAYKETYEIERKAQEVTGANRVTLGTAGSVRDSNQTLGGMELLKQAAADRFIKQAYLIGKKFIIQSARKYMELIYQNMDEESIKRILGNGPVESMEMEDPMTMGEPILLTKWKAFKKLTPMDLDMDYDFVFVDVFNEENKFARSQEMKSYGQFLATVLPQWNPLPLAKLIGNLSGLRNEEVVAIVGEIQSPIPTPMAMGHGVPSIAKASKPTINNSPMTPNPMANGVAPQ